MRLVFATCSIIEDRACPFLPVSVSGFQRQAQGTKDMQTKENPSFEEQILRVQVPSSEVCSPLFTPKKRPYTGLRRGLRPRGAASGEGQYEYQAGGWGNLAGCVWPGRWDGERDLDLVFLW